MTPTFTRTLDYSPFMSWLARLIFGVFGWRVEGGLPDYPKMVVVAAHHTSNWDGVIFFFMTLILRVRLNYLGKHTLFEGPFGFFFRWSGGIPIDRSASANAVEQAIQSLRDREQMVLVLAPEGTRKKVEHWKSGFYYIALGAGVPIALGYADYRRHRAGIGPVFFPTGDIEADLEIIRAFYADKTPHHPEKIGPISFPPAR